MAWTLTDKLILENKILKGQISCLQLKNEKNLETIGNLIDKNTALDTKLECLETTLEENEYLKYRVLNSEDEKYANSKTISNLLEKNATLDRKLEFIEKQFKELKDNSHLQSEKIRKLDSHIIAGSKTQEVLNKKNYDLEKTIEMLEEEKCKLNDDVDITRLENDLRKKSEQFGMLENKSNHASAVITERISNLKNMIVRIHGVSRELEIKKKSLEKELEKERAKLQEYVADNNELMLKKHTKNTAEFELMKNSLEEKIKKLGNILRTKTSEKDSLEGILSVKIKQINKLSNENEQLNEEKRVYCDMLMKNDKDQKEKVLELIASQGLVEEYKVQNQVLENQLKQMKSVKTCMEEENGKMKENFDLKCDRIKKVKEEENDALKIYSQKLVESNDNLTRTNTIMSEQAESSENQLRESGEENHKILADKKDLEEKIANLLKKNASLDCKVQSLEAKLKQKSQFVLECVNKLQTEMLVEKEEYVEPEYSDNLIPKLELPDESNNNPQIEIGEENNEYQQNHKRKRKE